MHCSFHPEAENELARIYAYYDVRKKGLGREFLLQVNLGVNRLMEHPYSGPKIKAETRRLLINRFPYALLYRVSDDEIRIGAVAHLSRDPNFWDDRF